jgi:serine/threonine protein kinase/WD40 repeat protein/tetratricopeptide (TPR) repeat protein
MEPKRVDRIFWEAAQIESAQQRHRYLENACAGDEPLRRKVEQLLAAQSKACDFLESPMALIEDTLAIPVSEGVGTVIGPYKLMEQIGEGGMGLVFVAEQQRPVRRKIALKVIKPGLDTREVIVRFEAERQALALMDHPNIARVLDAGTTDTGRPFFVMELVRGVPITQFCDENRLTPRERLELFIDVCLAVQHAHQKGVIHRDLKPSNILVTLHDGRPVVKVIDFGVAKAMGGQLTEKTIYTRFAQILGTPLYMSPEQAEMTSLDVDTRSDIYSLGVLLYELLTGTTPMDRERLGKAAYDEIRRIIREEDPPKPSTRISTLGQTATTVSANRKSDPKRLSQLFRGELDWIVMKCLEKDRSRRYETANSLALDLGRYLADEPVQACPPSAAYRFRKFARRNKAVFTTTALIALALVAGMVVSIWQAIRAKEAEGVARAAEMLAEQRLGAEKRQRQRAVEAELQGKHRLFEAKRSEAMASRYSGRPGQRYASLQALTEAAQLARELQLGEDQFRQLSDEAIACMALADVQPVNEWLGLSDGDDDLPAFDANLEHYARSDLRGNISVCRVGDSRELVRLPGPGTGAWFMRFHPQGDLLAAVYRGGGKQALCRVWRWRKQEVHFQPADGVAGRAALAFSPNGGQLAMGYGDGAVIIYDVQTGLETQRLKLDITPYTMDFHPDGDKLAAASQEQGQVRVVRLSTGEQLLSAVAPFAIFQVDWRSDGSLLAAACARGKVCLWNLVTGIQHAILDGHQADVEGLAFTPNGDLLASYAYDGTSRLWDPWTGSEVVQIQGRVNHISRDSRRLAGRRGQTMFVCELATGRECRTLSGMAELQGEVSHGAMDLRSGRWLAVGGVFGVCLWDLALGKEVARIPLGNIYNWRNDHIQFEPGHDDLVVTDAHESYRWSLREINGVLKVGPPSRLSNEAQDRLISLLRAQHYDEDLFTISPDGQWAVTSAGVNAPLKAWDARTGKFQCELSIDLGRPRVAFSRDSRWLATGSPTAFHLWETSSWRNVWEIPREQADDLVKPCAFSPDGQVVAFPSSLNVVQLVETESGRPIARLESPESGPIWWLTFSPDGGQLVTSTQAGVVKLWDLRRIREQLRAIGLDWDRPAYPAAPSWADAKPLRVEVHLGEALFAPMVQDAVARGRARANINQWRQAIEYFSNAIEMNPLWADVWMHRGIAYAATRQWEYAVDDLSQAIELEPWDPNFYSERGKIHQRVGEAEKAIADYTRVLELLPGSSQAILILADLLVDTPNDELRNTASTLALAQRGVDLEPANAWAWSVLGRAYYRTGDWRLSIEAFEKSSVLDPPTERVQASTWFYRAMAHAQLGDKQEAIECFANAVQLAEQRPPSYQGLAPIEVEARLVLSLYTTPPEPGEVAEFYENQ